MIFDDVYIVSDALDTVPIDTVQSIESQLRIAFPKGYREYVSTLGVGVYSEYIRIYLPSKISDQYTQFQQRWKEHYFWDSHIVSKDDVLNSIIIGDTLDGDEIIFHPSNPHAIYILPRHDTNIYLLGDSLTAALNWLCSSGTLTAPILFKYFEPLDNRGRISLLGESSTFNLNHTHNIASKIILHQYIDQKDEDELIQIFIKEYGAIIDCLLLPSGDIAVDITYDSRKHQQILQELIYPLQKEGLHLNGQV